MKNDPSDRMPDLAFRMMAATMAVKDRLFPTIDERVATFRIKEGMTLVDYGCGPGRYTMRFAKLVGGQGKVYAVDVQELALEYVRRKMGHEGLSNIIPILARGYRADIADHVADMVFALDMIFGVQEPVTLLRELHRISSPAGVLIVDDGHQPRERTLHMIQASGQWRIEWQGRDHLRCSPLHPSAA
jgi:ubiquinone/menaquinone biosynthesis C-methylase UbiE